MERLVTLMSRVEAKKKQVGFTEVKEVPSSTILVHCRTVVEKNGFVSTGIMTHVEGDLLEIEISDSNRFVLGENVRLTVYTPAGMYLIPSTIVGKDTGSLMMINPPENQRKFNEKRIFPRVEISRSGKLAAWKRKGAIGIFEEADQLMTIDIKNISLSGIGFTLPDPFRLEEHTELKLELELGSLIACTAKVIRMEKGIGSTYYGAQYVEMEDVKINSLRAFILREQITALSTSRKEANKRTFK
jgi:hypothetical protein